MKEEKIVIYGNKQCPYCKQVKEVFDKNKIKFTNKDTVENIVDWKKIMDLTGMAQIPVIYYKDDYFLPGRDYSNPDNLIEVIKSYKKCTIPKARHSIERLKSLNYNISMAFQRTDALLRKIEEKINKQ